MAAGRQGKAVQTKDVVLDALDQMEPELRHLQGILITLRALGETADSVEPIVLAALGRSGCETIESILQSFETATAAARSEKRHDLPTGRWTSCAQQAVVGMPIA